MKEGWKNTADKNVSLTQRDVGRRDWGERLARGQLASHTGSFGSFKACGLYLRTSGSQ